MKPNPIVPHNMNANTLIPPPKVHVVGDSCIDEYYKVKVTRIDPEVPYLSIMLSPNDSPYNILPGMAANVCYQLQNYHTTTKLVSFLDLVARKIFESFGIDTSLSVPSNNIPRKRRWYEGLTQVSHRWDIETPVYPYEEITLYEKPDVVIFSDYNKGFFDYYKDWSFYKDCISIVDPKKNLDIWKGCTIFKPNAKEAFELSGGLTDWKEQSDFFLSRLGCQSVVITREGDGVVGKTPNGYFEVEPNNKSTVINIVGAGDSFVAALAVAIVRGHPVELAVELAWNAAQQYVSQER